MIFINRKHRNAGIGFLCAVLILLSIYFAYRFNLIPHRQYKNHIGIVSDKRNRKGMPFIIHHANPLQPSYVEDILETWGTIVGHYRIGA